MLNYALVDVAGVSFNFAASCKLNFGFGRVKGYSVTVLRISKCR